MEDIFLLLRDDAGGWVFLERAVSLLLAHLKVKGNLSECSAPRMNHEAGTPYSRGDNQVGSSPLSVLQWRVWS